MEVLHNDMNVPNIVVFSCLRFREFKYYYVTFYDVL